MDVRELARGSRVALLVPGSAAYAELVVALLRRKVFPVPMDVKLTASERADLLAELQPALVVTGQAQLENLLAAVPDDPASPPPGRPIHLTSGTTGRPEGVFSGPLEREEADTLVAEERDRVLGEVDGVEDIAVCGVADDRWGQRVCAAVVGTVDDATLQDLVERPD